MNSIPRPGLLRQLAEGLERSPIVTILGPRQCGKTTLARAFCRGQDDVVFLDLESPADAARLSEPLLYLEKQRGLVVLDEVQAMPAVLNVLRDSGILHSLLDIPRLDALFAHPKLGASWEGFVIEQICCAAPRSQAYFWATHTGAEVDLLLLHQGRRLGFECKVADAPKATKSMHIALQDLALDEIFVISPRAGSYPLAPKITACGLGEAIAALREIPISH